MPWPNAEQAGLLAQAVRLYRAAFMGQYNFVDGYTLEDFWDQVFTVYFEHFPEELAVDKAKYAKAMLDREEVRFFCTSLSRNSISLKQIKNYINWRVRNWIIWP